MAALKYWLWLTSRKGVDAGTALALLDHFGSPERAFYARGEDYAPVALSKAAREGLQDKSLDDAERIWEECERLGLRILTYQDSDYPERLRQIPQPPAVLYVRGKVFPFDEMPAIGVVGTRDPSAYGERWAGQLSMELAAGGALVVSGTARGVDTCAIKGALKAGGSVVCVLGGGVNVPYPAENRYLYEDVAAVGALMTEYPPGTRNLGDHFPRRNRILTGLTVGVLAVECLPRSGTMSSVNHALEQDRDVFAVPGSLDADMSLGTNLLIRQGARLVTCGEDILCEYRSRFPHVLSPRRGLEPEVVESRLQPDKPAQKSAPAAEPETKKTPVIPVGEQKTRFTDDELDILAALEEKNSTADELVERTQIPARRVLTALTMLQVQQAVEEGPGRRFAPLVKLER